MSRKLVVVLSLFALLSSVLCVRFNPVEVKAPTGYPVHNIDTGLDYTNIQEAISASETKDGHTIRVDARTYHEHVSISKSIKLVGENRDTVIVDGNGAETVFWITAANASITNITVRNAYFGIVGYGSSNVTIYHNRVYYCGLVGIHLDGDSSDCKIEDNIVLNCVEGIELERSARNAVEENNLINNNASIVLNRCGSFNVFRKNNMTSAQYNLIVVGYSLDNFMQDIDDSNIVNNKAVYYLTSLHDLTIDPFNYPNLGYLAAVNCTSITVRDFNITHNGDGVLLAYSKNCTLANGTISGNRGPLMCGGLTFYESSNNKIINNKISNNSYAVCLYRSDENIFYHNSFFHNDRQVVSDFLLPFSNMSSGYFSTNVWDNSVEGNYWSDYGGVDLNHDGIGEMIHIIDSNNQDRYPLMGMFSDFVVTVEGGKVYNVQVVSNSSVHDLSVVWWLSSPSKYLQPGQKFIRFIVSDAENTTGFCRVTIPRAVLNGTYIVLIDWTEVETNELPVSNSTHAYLYFTYNHTEHEVIIVSEFPSFLILSPLFMIATTLAAIVYRRKRPRL